MAPHANARAVPSSTRRRGRRPLARAGELFVVLDPAATVPLYEQIARGMRDAIRDGRLAPGTRIPSTRALAADFAVSRSTVLLAVGQLVAEGFLRPHARSGTQVATALPDALLTVERRAPVTQPLLPNDVLPNESAPKELLPNESLARLGARGLAAQSFADPSTRLGAAPRPFRHGTPAIDRFPTDLWARLAAKRYQRLGVTLLDSVDAAGYAPLREAICAHVQTARGVRCTPEQVIITSGAQQAMALVTHVLLDAGDRAWVEDPGYASMRGALAMADARAVPVPVDGDGLDVREGIRRAPDARMVYVTPSHQFPLGITMTLDRRRELLAWAERAGAWIVEDDYESECRFAGKPLPALQSLDRSGRVLYVGTFSKTVFPSLRLGYLIAPRALTAPILNAKMLSTGQASTMEQAILADFMTENHFARHVRRMRALYAERQGRLVAAAERELAGLLRVPPSAAGLHLLGWLPEGVSDRAVSAALAARGVEATPLSHYYASGHCSPGALMLGYGALDDHALAEGIAALRAVLERTGIRS